MATHVNFGYLVMIALIGSALNLVTPVTVGNFISSLENHQNNFSGPLILLVFFSLSSTLWNFFSQWFTIKYSRRFQLNLQGWLLHELEKFNPGALAAYENGALAMKFTRDTDMMAYFVRDFVISGITAIIGIIGAAMIIFNKNWIIGCVFLANLPFCLLFCRPVERKLEKLNHVMRTQMDISMNSVFNYINQLPYLKATASATNFSSHLMRTLEDLNKQNLCYDFTNMQFRFIIQAFFFLGEHGVLAIGGFLAWRGDIEIGDVVMFQMLFLQALGALSGVLDLMPLQATINEAVDSLTEINDGKGKEEDIGKLALRDFKGNVVLSHVSFAYPDSQRHIIDDISMECHPGECVIITGDNGSGKTTLSKLMTTFCMPDKGNIFFDGHDAKDLQRDAIRSQISIMFQDSILVNGTFRDNLTLGYDYPEEELTNIVKRCHLESVLKKLPHGYDTVLDEGCSLSGGERQKVALARALLKKPKLAVFDEITNHLDIEFRSQLFDIINKLKQNCAVLMISHDEKMISLADKIINLS